MSNALKVGIFAAVVLAALAAFVLRIEDLNPFAPEGQTVDALFDSVVGLDDKAAVRVAGVRVGRVDGIGLEGRRARVTLLLEQPVQLTQGSRAAVKSAGLLGDKYIELIPGPDGAPALPEDALLEGETPVSFDEAMGRLDAIGESIQEMTGSLTGGGPGAGALPRLLDNLEVVSAQVRDLIDANQQQVGATIRNFENASGTLARELPRLADRMDALLAQVSEVVADNRGELAASMENIRRITEELQPAVVDLRTISGRLASGEGTLGKLLNSDETHDQLVSTLGSIESGVEGLSDTLGAVRELGLDLQIEGFYLNDLEESQASFQLDISTRSDWLYRVAVVDSVGGKDRKKTQTQTITNPDGSVDVRTIETLTVEDELTLSALLGMELGEARVYAGLIESDFGVQVEYPLFDRRVLFSMEAFDFNREDDLEPHLRLQGEWKLHPNLYLLGGYDDFLVDDQESFFIGAGIRWQDDDLKYLLGSVPTGF